MEWNKLEDFRIQEYTFGFFNIVYKTHFCIRTKRKIPTCMICFAFAIF